MDALSSRAVRMTVGGVLVALAACTESPLPTSPKPVLTPQLAPGDEILVTSSSGGTEPGSLRWAASQVTGGEVIRFAPGLAGSTIILDSTVVLDYYATIEGPADEGITISGGGNGRVFEFRHYPGEVVLRNLTVTGGDLPATGGAGILSLTSALRLENSTVKGNVGFTYPAIWASRATLVNSTVSGNTATIPYSAGSVVYANGLSLVNATVAYNTGGVASEQLVLHNTIVANHDRLNCASSEIFYLGRNLADDDSCGAAGDIMIAGPALVPLADNGGPTMTHALADDSPAINAGTDCSVTVDQRYVSRDAPCDLGAYEAPSVTSVFLTMASSAPVEAVDGKVVMTGTVRCSGNGTFDLLVELAQKRGRGAVSATGTTSIGCSPEAYPWRVELMPAGGSFQNGPAQAVAMTINTSDEVRPTSLSQSIKLFTAKK